MELPDTTETKVALDDLAIVAAAIDRGDRLLYRADNLADRSEFVVAREAYERVEERQRRLLGFFESVSPRASSDPKGVMEMIAHVGETLDPEWTIEKPVKAQPEEEE